MPENNKRSTPRLLIAAMGLTAGLMLAPQAFAGPQMGYVLSSSGEVWTSAGGCVKSLNENPQKRAECGDDMGTAEPAPKAETPKLAPVAATPPVTPGAVNCDTTVHFDFDRSVLKADMKKMLDAMASKVGSSAAAEKVMIVGHTDSVGSENYNMGLSNRRAKAVASYLQTKGVNADMVKGEGESKPIASNASNDGRAKNRRAEVTCQ